MRRGFLWFAAGLFFALIAGLIAIFVLQRAVTMVTRPEEEPKVRALVAARDIPLHTVISAADVTLRELPVEAVPQDGLTGVEEALGQLTTADIAQGEVILRRRLIEPDYVGPKAAFVMDPDKVLIAFPANDLLGRLDIIRPGDRIDIHFSHDFAKGRQDEIVTGMNTVAALQDVQVAAVVREQTLQPGQTAGQPGQAVVQPQQATTRPAVTAILLAVAPQDALMLKYLRDSGGVPDLVLRSPAAGRGPVDLTPIDTDYLLERYEIRWREKK